MSSDSGKVSRMGRALASARDFAVLSMTDRIVYNYTGNHADHSISLVKPLEGGRAFLVARGPGPSVDDIVVVRVQRGREQRIARFQVEQIRHTSDGWRAYCRPVQSP